MMMMMMKKKKKKKKIEKKIKIFRRDKEKSERNEDENQDDYCQWSLMIRRKPVRMITRMAEA